MPRVPNAAPVMRIVADTNTVLSGLLWPGPPRRLLDLARQRAFTLCTSPILLAELAEVIARDKFVQRVLAAGLSACALAAQAILIVSGDKHLLDLHPYHGIPILPAAAALQRLQPNTTI